jgi:hypothetical protein
MSIHTSDQIVSCMAIEGNLERQEAEILHHVEKFAMQSTPDLSSPRKTQKEVMSNKHQDMYALARSEKLQTSFVLGHVIFPWFVFAISSKALRL